MKIMFVCYGNICRSPMAEFIMKKLVRDKGLGHRIEISSSATSSEEIINGIGNPMYPPAVRELDKRGIPHTPRHAVRLRADDIDKHDLFIGVEESVIRDMRRILGSAAAHKIKKLLDYTPRGGDVADPWYTNRFDIAYNDIYEGCEALLAAIAD